MRENINLKAKDKVFYSKITLNIKGKPWVLDTPKVMGILNVTPDSFYDGGRFNNEDAMLKQVEKLIEEGASIIDIGGYSTRSGAPETSEDEETFRVVKSIDNILKRFPETLISVDTFRSGVAMKAVESGAVIINDVSGGTLDDKMFETVAKAKVPYILMHMRGNPNNMQTLVDYHNLLEEMLTFFQVRVHALQQAGVADIIIDPGFGFAKTIPQNFEILRNLNYFQILNLPILAGLSRKSTIYKSLNIEAAEALNGTTVLNTIALVNGAKILRVHDVKEAVEAIKLYNLTYH